MLCIAELIIHLFVFALSLLMIAIAAFILWVVLSELYKEGKRKEKKSPEWAMKWDDEKKENPMERVRRSLVNYLKGSDTRESCTQKKFELKLNKFYSVFFQYSSISSS